MFIYNLDLVISYTELPKYWPNFQPLDHKCNTKINNEVDNTVELHDSIFILIGIIIIILRKNFIILQG